LHYQFAHSEDAVSFHAKELVPSLRGYTSTLISTALDEIERSGLAESNYVNAGTKQKEDWVKSFWITPKGIQLVDNWTETAYAQYSEGVNLDVEDSGTQKTAENLTPASDRFVTRNDNSDDYRIINSTIASIDERLATANDVGDLTPEERVFARDTLQAALKLFKAAQVRVSAVTNSVIPFLKWLGLKIVDNALSTLLTTALTALIAYFGLS
jgi:hypothetical protein